MREIEKNLDWLGMHLIRGVRVDTRTEMWRVNRARSLKPGKKTVCAATTTRRLCSAEGCERKLHMNNKCGLCKDHRRK